jgi:hypothetical protein
MFVQVLKGKTANPDAMVALGEKWQKELRPGATGYLGSTVGATTDGEFVAVIQFSDDVAAKANSDRPEQDAFFKEMSQYIDGEPVFRESSDTSLLFGGPSEKATFVQIMESTCKDRAKAEATEPAILDELRKSRPDLLGGLRVWNGDQAIEVAYFTSESEARQAEQSPDFSAQTEEFMSLYDNMTFTDLLNPQINLA